MLFKRKIKKKERDNISWKLISCFEMVCLPRKAEYKKPDLNTKKQYSISSFINLPCHLSEHLPLSNWSILPEHLAATTSLQGNFMQGSFKEFKLVLKKGLCPLTCHCSLQCKWQNSYI